MSLRRISGESVARMGVVFIEKGAVSRQSEESKEPLSSDDRFESECESELSFARLRFGCAVWLRVRFGRSEAVGVLLEVEGRA